MKKSKQEFNLSKKAEILTDFNALVPERDYPKDEEGFGRFWSDKTLKEFIKKLKERIKQEKIPKQIIKSKYYTGYIKHNKQVDDLINDIDKLAGDKLFEAKE